MGFLEGLGNIVNEQFSFGENTVTSLDADGTDRVGDFGLLGDFAKQFDRSAERTYYEDGLIRNVRPRLRNVLWQEPNMTVLIKKRMFSSLVENYKLDLLEDNEKLFIKASKRLFANKTKAIAAYERLSKIENIAKDAGQLNSHMIPTLLGGLADFEQTRLSIFDANTRSAFDKLRKVYAFSRPSSVSKWSIDQQMSYESDLGEGTGVIELTMVRDVNTRVATQFGAGSATLNIEDPYKLMIVTNRDIDRAISDSTNFFKSSGFGRVTQLQTRDLIDTQKAELNQLRRARGVSEINFIVTPETLLSKRVRAIVDREGREVRFTFNPGLVGIGSAVDIDPTEVQGQTVIRDQAVIRTQLTSNEADLFKDIIKNIFLLLGYENTTHSEIREFNELTNYVRRKLRLHYANKPIIQPMDIVNIFMQSKSQLDERLIQGFNSQQNAVLPDIANTINTLVRNINNFGAKNSQLTGAQMSLEEIEKSAVVGSDFPTWLWRIHRNDFTRQDAGLAVFVGLVKGASHSYSAGEGKYSLSVSCEDNSGYFNKSQINIRPALDVFNGNLYDPLTPFDLSFDASTGTPITDDLENFIPDLLPENIAALNSCAIKFKAGRFRGTRVRDFLFKANDRELNFAGFRRILNEPDGLVYRWKEGIEAVTRSSRTIIDSSIGAKEKSPRLTKDPFAGQDVMNVLSLLVTGQPYNFNTFFKAAISNANSIISRNEKDGEDIANSYIDGIVTDLSKRNAVWGNFVPFKKLTVNEAALAFIQSGRNDFTRNNRRLSKLIERRASLQDALFTANATQQGSDAFARDDRGQLQAPDVGSQNLIDIINIESEIAELDFEIEKAKSNFVESVKNISQQNRGNIRIIGDDLSLDPTLSDAQNALTESQEQLDRTELRRKINFLTQRRLWQVKANEDPNLFVVDDQYDKNWDIQAFERAIQNNLALFASEYTTVDGQIRTTAQLLGLEVFADSQGHIHARPPLYNRVPRSVFQQLLKEKAERGVQVFPQFLESLYSNQIQGLIDRIESTEDQIRYHGAVLGLTNDKEIKDFVTGNSTSLREAVGPNAVGKEFAFVSDEATGKISGNFRKFFQQAKPDANENNASKSLQELSRTLESATQSQVLFDAASRSDTTKSNNFISSFSATAQDRTARIRDRLRKNKGVQIQTPRQLLSDDRSSSTFPKISQLDSLHLLNKISGFVNERQRLLLIATNAIKNLSQGLQLNEGDKGATSALFPMLNRKKDEEFPEILEHMIQEEDDDTLGPGSGARFVIKEFQIINLSIEETPPDYTMVQVNGLFGQGFVQAPANLRVGPDNGNALTTAFAVDYDLWRMYGFKASTAVPAPFFSDPDAQCAPYAVYLLNLARKNILQGSVTVAGNEYYQAGDVVYIEDRDLLFYVDSVQHSFSYSGSFTTTLTLKYGHNPGEYIPTILDIVGKGLYNARSSQSKFRNVRFDSANGDIPVGALIFDNTDFLIASPLESLLSGSRGEQNRKTMKNILSKVSQTLLPVGRNNKFPVLELRVYTCSNVVPPNASLEGAANDVQAWFSNPQKFSISKGSIIGTTEETQAFRLPPDSVRVVTVDAFSDTELSPSAAAWSAVRILNGNPFPTNREEADFSTEANNLDTLLFSHIIDAWITFDPVDESNESKPRGTVFDDAKSQAEAGAREIAARRRSEQ